VSPRDLDLESRPSSRDSTADVAPPASAPSCEAASGTTAHAVTASQTGASGGASVNLAYAERLLDFRMEAAFEPEDGFDG
jgi:hypothetical protein